MMRSGPLTGMARQRGLTPGSLLDLSVDQDQTVYRQLVLSQPQQIDVGMNTGGVRFARKVIAGSNVDPTGGGGTETP